MKQSVSSNTFYLISGFIGQKFLSFVFFTLIARLFGVSTTGAYTFALSYTTFFAVFIDIGFSPFLIREVARDRDRAQKLLQTVLSAKVFLSALAALVVVVTVPFMNKTVTVDQMVYIAAIIMMVDSITLSFWAVLRGYQNLKYEALNIVISQALIMAAGVAVFWLRLSAVGLILAVLSGSVYQFLVSGYLVKKKLRIKIWPVWDKTHLIDVLKISWPFGLSQILTRFYSYFDQIFLGLIKGEYDLGLYSVPYKITFALQFIPQALGSALFPALSDYFVNDKPRLRSLFEQSLKYLTIIAIPASLGIGVLAEPIILLVYGQEYQPSILALKIMMVGLIFVFLNFPVGAFLNAVGRQSQQTFNLALTLISNLVVNVVLIPRYSFLGASVAVAVSMAVLFFSGLWRVSQEMKWEIRGFARLVFKVLASALVMAAVIWYVEILIGPGAFRLVYLATLPLLGAFIYFLCLSFLGGVRRADWEAARRILRRKSPI